MRDIRGDLQERASVCQEQIRSTIAHFEQRIQQLQNERDMRLEDLKSGLAMIERFMEFENRLADNVVNLENPAPRPSLADRIKAASA
jgi:predicted component of type VI protein secretion system